MADHKELEKNVVIDNHPTVAVTLRARIHIFFFCQINFFCVNNHLRTRVGNLGSVLNVGEGIDFLF